MPRGSQDSGLLSRLFGRTRRAVLVLLYMHPEQSFYLSQILRRTGTGRGALQRELKALAEAGIVERTETGHQVYYKANRDCPIFAELQALVVKTAGVADVVRAALEPLRDRLKLALVYGSFACGEQRADSDVDLLVVGEVGFRDVSSAIGPAETTLDREINPTVYPVPEFREKARTGHHFIRDVLDSPKLFLIGDERDVDRLVGRGTSKEA